jgi:hypothetical protein
MLIFLGGLVWCCGNEKGRGNVDEPEVFAGLNEFATVPTGPTSDVAHLPSENTGTRPVSEVMSPVDVGRH